MSPGRTVLSASSPARPRPTVRPDPTRTLYVRVLDSTNPNPDTFWAGEATHGRAARPGRAAQGGVGQRRFGAPKGQLRIVFSRTTGKTGLGFLRKHNNQGKLNRLDDSKTRTYHGRVGSGRTAERRGGVGQDWGLQAVWREPLFVDPPWREPPRVGNTGQRDASIIITGNCFGLSLGLKKSMIVLRRPRVQSLQVVLGNRQTTALLLP